MIKKLVVDGFSFETDESYNEAMKEAEAVSYLTSRTDMDDMAVLMKLYNKLIEKKSFTTPVGIGFLKKLYDSILSSGLISKENLKPIPVKMAINKENKKSDSPQPDESKLMLRLSRINIQLKNARIMNVFFVIIILAFFVITMLGDYSPFTDAEVAAQNKYAEWEESLTEREKIINEREKELGLK